ncbi:hypothetical protein [Mycobacteroides chelonae]|uniref:Lipoprotein n=2 Tax=Mycobacteroides immunogenum TaxID=83262 RepID=A0A179VBT3_9MYCO|nr:hypothetical protein [Mycobacteroides chelonae]OAT68435.1 hypothetical protein AWB85_25010 [Mycobacteroides immunogenum]MBF9315607.1 hypothetical protein [Mycobacteroides chelonae]OHT75395.1 hypothetical protein BKG67_06725 [Mycobacteroides chelonae]OHT75524.1 hypothetical protein BKG66_00340 [Mycobacteroides chelonae]OHT91986.1 hypothetical protein BKG70_05045 [Mycobacteroides chelonae]
MSTNRALHTLISVTSAALAIVLAGCAPGPGWTDQGSDIVSELKIDIPENATNIVGNTDSGVRFLMPNDKWRDYITEYYPGKALTPFPITSDLDGSVPATCIPAYRSGVKLTTWVAGEDIQYRDTGRQKRRSVFVTPDCEPDKAYVQWTLK